MICCQEGVLSMDKIAVVQAAQPLADVQQKLSALVQRQVQSSFHKGPACQALVQ